MSEILLFLGTEEDKSYAPYLKPCVGNATVFTKYSPVGTLAEVIAYCKAPGPNGKSRGITGVITTNTLILKKLLANMGNHKDKVSLADYQGSYFKHQGIEFVFISPLAQLFTVPYGEFIARRFISKLTEPASWHKSPAFSWEVMTASNYQRLFKQFESAIMIGVDIETQRAGLRIDSISYTALFLDKNSGKFTTHTAVLELNDMFAVTIMRKFNWDLKAPKALQNGKYDVSYLCRYAAPIYNWLWDTQNMFHCWYAELPKDLGFLAAFHVREIVYWKDLADSPDKMEQLRYNALDTWTTVLVVINWLLEAPEWAKYNYKKEFPLNFACHLSEMTGIKRDMEALVAANKEVNVKIEAGVISLSRMLGLPQGVLFNTNSPPQVTRLRKVLGCEDIPNGDEKALKKMGLRHPLNGRIVNKILEIRKLRKLEGTYLPVATPEDQIPFMNKKDIVEGKELPGTSRILYSINPTTETGRMASSEHHFWCGLNIQNQPRGDAVKKTFIADEDFMFAECDLKQAESRDTGYLAGEENLIAAVTGKRDFHAVNASAFFGTPYEKIFDDETSNTLDKALRDLAKRTNHGANYLMGEQVLVDTMGEDKVWEAKRLLGLPRSYGLLDVAHHLLEVFHATYPGLRAVYYPAVTHEVMTTRMLRHHAVINEPEVYGLDPIWKVDWELEPLEGWTRYCFGTPTKNKLDKNSYVAHVSQGFNARKLNVAYLRVFYEIALNPKYAPHFKLCAQIHDSILFQFRKGHEYLADMVRERMEVAAKVRGYDGNIRTYTVPADIKAGKDGLGALRWSETE
jgi:DNA polymerase I-like protein with 3'-5' exonuclease and polymerase domains